MKWTFGIITDGKFRDNIHQIIDSIEKQNIHPYNYEIIIVGGDPFDRKNVKHIPFDETIKEKPWITRKKNLIIQNAKFDNICLTHDYLIFKPNWYKGFLSLGEDWDVAVCKIADTEGFRYRDHVSWYCELNHEPGPNAVQLLDYDDLSQTNKQYISGAFYCIKKSFGLKYPLDEKLLHSDGEDAMFAYTCRDFWNYKVAKESMVQLIKYKPRFPYNEEKLCEPHREK